ncbi:unnamed protein product [Rhizopus stolonifer]
MNYTQDFNTSSDDSTLPSTDFHSYSLLADNRQDLLFHTNANEPDSVENSLPEAWNPNNSVSPRGSQRGIAGFVSKLYQCLQSSENEQKYAQWCKHQGRDMFVIERIPEFTEVVLPSLFKHCKFPSFVRQLNIYGFQRDTDARKSKDSKDKDSCRWYHPYFKPGRRDLFHLIRRKATRYTRKKKAKNQEDSETILRMDDGEEDDDKDEGYSRHESFSSSSSVTLQHAYNTSSTLIHAPFVESKSLDAAHILDNSESHGIKSDQRENCTFNIYQERQQYEKVHGYYSEKLTAAHNKIKEQQMQIQRLEAMVSTTKSKAQEEYINVIYSAPYYNQAPVYSNNLPQVSSFPFRNTLMSHAKSEDNTQSWIPGYADSMRSTNKECNLNK